MTKIQFSLTFSNHFYSKRFKKEKIALVNLFYKSDRLPDYLGFRKKSKNQVAPKISIDRPVGKVLPKKDQPFLILWRDNFDGDVSIKLYDGNKLIQNISSRTASDGVYEWKPRISVKEGYFIRIFSWKERNIFGQLQL